MTTYVRDYIANSVSDEDILMRARLGDRNACLVLFHRYYARVEAYARLCSADASMAEEIACTVFQHIYRAADGSGPATEMISKGRSCLCLLLQHCRGLIDPAPSQDPGGRCASVVDDAPAIAPHPRLPLLSADLPADRAILNAALSCLSREDREIIHLAFEPGLSRYDIAVLTDKPSTAAVVSHLYCAMQRLATRVERLRCD